MTNGSSDSLNAPAILRARSRTPRILYVSPHWPHRASGAPELRAFHVARALGTFADVQVIVMDDEGRPEEGKRRDHQLDVAFSVPVHPRPNRGVLDKVAWAIDPRRRFPHGCGVSDEDARRVERTAAGFDMTWFCKLRTPNMFPQWSWPASVVDVDDVPSTYEQSLLQTELSLPSRVATHARALTWTRRERLLGERFTVLAACSEADRRYLQSLGVAAPIHVIPNGSDRPAGEPVRHPATPPRIGFVGIFDYLPNASGVRWFATECWPRIASAVPGARLRLVGRDSDGPLKPAGGDIDGLGFVDDIAAEIATWSLMIVPIRIGAGTRGKIAQAFGLKCPVVSTPLGAYGYDAVDGEFMRLADTAGAFVDACVQTIRDQNAARAMADRAWTAFLERWTWDAIRPRIQATAEDCLRVSEYGARPGSDMPSSPEKSLTRA